MDDYHESTKEERDEFLLLWKYVGMVIKLSSEKMVGGVSHIINSVHKPSTKQVLGRIRKKSVE